VPFVNIADTSKFIRPKYGLSEAMRRLYILPRLWYIGSGKGGLKPTRRGILYEKTAGINFNYFCRIRAEYVF
jgi:hypothetical protein